MCISSKIFLSLNLTILDSFWAKIYLHEQLKNKDDLKNKVDLKNENDLKNEDNLINEDNLKN